MITNITYFVGLGRAEFVNKVVSFDDHIQTEHNLWHYLYFIVLLKLKKRTDFTGPQSYVNELIRVSMHLIQSSEKLRCFSCACSNDLLPLFFHYSNESWSGFLE
jgi:hypothetical protein